MAKHVAIYVRVSSNPQDTRSQEPELELWAAAQGQPVKWFRDKATGKTMERPGWQKLAEEIRMGKVSAVVVWRTDRLGRTAKGLTALFDDLQQRKINLISLKDGLDLSTSAGRLMANVLASVAQYETEVRGERVAAGQAAARAQGKRWGGSKRGTRKKVSVIQAKMIQRMKQEWEPITAIAKAVGLSRPTVYSVLAEASLANLNDHGQQPSNREKISAIPVLIIERRHGQGLIHRTGLIYLDRSATPPLLSTRSSKGQGIMSKTTKSHRFASLIRVSTEKQERQGESLRTQESQIKAAVAELGGVIARRYAGQEHATAGWERSN